MASKLISRSFKNLNSLNRIITNSLSHSKPNFTPISSLKKNFSVTSYFSQQSNNAFQDLRSFLKDEIKTEKDLHKQKSQPTTIKGFDVKTEGPNVTLTKTHNGEQITVKFNVTNSVGDDHPEDSPEFEQKTETETPVQMKSKPTFSVDIKKNNKVLSFECSYLPAEFAESKDAPATDDFQLDQFTIHDGDWNENVYSVDCSILDGNLYDILLNVLDERGVGEEFANQLVEFSTAYEHKLYIGLLEQLQDFAK